MRRKRKGLQRLAFGRWRDRSHTFYLRTLARAAARILLRHAQRRQREGFATWYRLVKQQNRSLSVATNNDLIGISKEIMAANATILAQSAAYARLEEYCRLKRQAMHRMVGLRCAKRQATRCFSLWRHMAQSTRKLRRTLSTACTVARCYRTRSRAERLGAGFVRWKKNVVYQTRWKAAYGAHWRRKLRASLSEHWRSWTKLKPFHIYRSQVRRVCIPWMSAGCGEVAGRI